MISKPELLRELREAVDCSCDEELTNLLRKVITLLDEKCTRCGNRKTRAKGLCLLCYQGVWKKQRRDNAKA